MAPVVVGSAERAAVAGAQAPVADAQAPIADVQAPIADVQAPIADVQAPIADAQRIHALDALRGLALLGILVANVRQMFLPWDIANFPVALGVPEALAWLDWQFFHAFVEQKFLTIFSLLFGVGFALQAERLQASGRDFTRIYLRRVLILALFGVAHGLLLYPAEVLMPYALTALLLLAARGLSADTLMRAGLALLGLTVIWGYQIGALAEIDALLTLLTAALLAASVILTRGAPWALTLVLWAIVVLGVGAALSMRHAPPPDEPGVFAEYQQAQEQLSAMVSGDAAHWPEEYRVRREGGFMALVGLHAGQYGQLVLYMAVLLLWRTLGIFMIGAGAFRAGLLSPGASALWRHAGRWGLGIGVPLSLLATWLHTLEIQGVADWRAPALLHEFSSLVLAAGIAGAVFLRFAGGSAAPDRSGPLWDRIAAAGRMALTNYLGQSFVLAVLAEPWGFGLYGRLGGPVLTAIAFGVFAALSLASHAWLQRFRMGPLEWLWRCGTYWRWLPNRRRPRPAE